MIENKSSERFTDDSPFGPVIQKRADEGPNVKDKSLQVKDLQNDQNIIKRAQRQNT